MLCHRKINCTCCRLWIKLYKDSSSPWGLLFNEVSPSSSLWRIPSKQRHRKVYFRQARLTPQEQVCSFPIKILRLLPWIPPTIASWGHKGGFISETSRIIRKWIFTGSSWIRTSWPSDYHYQPGWYQRRSAQWWLNRGIQRSTYHGRINSQCLWRWCQEVTVLEYPSDWRKRPIWFIYWRSDRQKRIKLTFKYQGQRSICMRLSRKEVPQLDRWQYCDLIVIFSGLLGWKPGI